MTIYCCYLLKIIAAPYYCVIVKHHVSYQSILSFLNVPVTDFSLILDGCLLIYFKAVKKRYSPSSPGNCWANKKILFQLYLVKIHFDYRNKSYKTHKILRKDFVAKLLQTSAFWKADFWERNQINGKY